MKRGDAIFVVLAIFVGLMLIFAGCTRPVKPGNYTPATPSNASDSGELKSFKSWNEISTFLESSGSGGYRHYGFGRGMMVDMVNAPTAAKSASETSGAGQAASDFSKTNVQVEGVDEADLIKNDGKYIYAVAGSGYSYGNTKGKVVILDAYPASSMKTVSEINLDGSAQEIFVYRDKLVVFGSAYRSDVMPPSPPADCANCIMPPYYQQNFGYMKVYDVSSREMPKLEKEVEVKGSYQQSRMIDGKVYAVFNDGVNYQYPMPVYLVDGKAQQISPSEVKYFDWPDNSYNYNVFVSLDLNDLKKEETKKVVLMGAAQNLFVSKENIYVTYSSYDSYVPTWKAYEETYGLIIPSETKQRIKEIDAMNVSDWRKDRLKTAEAEKFAAAYLYNESRKDFISAAQKTLLDAQLAQKIDAIRKTQLAGAEKTVVNKIALDGFAYVAKGEVSGQVLNQFSMDEYGGYFRVATTATPPWNGGMMMRPIAQEEAPTTSNVYVLDKDLKLAGKLEGLAPGEKIYSARFMGERLYLVTFKQVDPLFVISLADPKDPKILGKLKIPGYSDYLHPYDSTHLIGIGKDVDESIDADKVHTPGAVYYTAIKGVKMSLFDVSDVSSPKEIAKYIIGDRGTDSYALQEHKAFLFSKEKNLLVLPITLAVIDKGKYPGGVPTTASGDYVFQGAYVFNVSLQDGFTLRGTVTHASQDDLLKSGEYFRSQSSVKRSLYMGSYLYTLSDQYVKANDLATVAPISSVQISNESSIWPTYYE